MKIDRKLFELFYYNDDGSFKSGPYYVYTWAEVYEMNKKFDITLPLVVVRRNMFNKIPSSGGQSIKVRIYRTSLKELINTINESADTGFKGVSDRPENTIVESLNAHPHLYMIYPKTTTSNTLPHFKNKKNDD